MMDVPDTSSLAAGLALPTPTLPADSKIAEFSMLQGLVNLEIWLGVAVPSLVIDVHGVDGAKANGATPELLASVCKTGSEVEPT
jgi:hypothetical protein